MFSSIQFEEIIYLVSTSIPSFSKHFSCLFSQFLKYIYIKVQKQSKSIATSYLFITKPPYPFLIWECLAELIVCDVSKDFQEGVYCLQIFFLQFAIRGDFFHFLFALWFLFCLAIMRLWWMWLGYDNHVLFDRWNCLEVCFRWYSIPPCCLKAVKELGCLFFLTYTNKPLDFCCHYVGSPTPIYPLRSMPSYSMEGEKTGCRLFYWVSA